MNRQLAAARIVQEPIRVLHLLPWLMLGGMEQGVVKLLNELPRERIVSQVCSFGWPDSLREQLRPDSVKERLRHGVRVHVLERRVGNDLGVVWRLIRLLRRERPHVLHSHSWGTLCEGYVASRLAGVPFFVHGEHGTMELRRRNVATQRWVWNRADRVLSVSSALAERMAREIGIPYERIDVIRNGVELAKFGIVPRSAARLAFGIPDEDFVIGTVGRLTAVKDHDTLLTSLVHLREAQIRCLALITGDGPLRADLEARADTCGVRGMVRFLGNRNDVARVLAALDVFVLTSTSEGLPNTILEAMAAGLPVVSTRVGGVPEVVEDGRTGLLTPARDAAAIGAAVARLARDPELRRQLGAAGLRKATAEFSLGRMLADYERLYVNLAVQHARDTSAARVSSAGREARGRSECAES